MTPKTLKQLLLPGVVGAVLIAVFVGIVGGALHSPKPKDLPIAIVGPAPITAQIQKAIATKAGDAVSANVYTNVQTATDDLRHEKVYGVITLQPGKLVATVSSASGEPAKQVVSQIGTNLGSALHMSVSTQDITPQANGAGHALVMMFSFLITTMAAIIGQFMLRRAELGRFWLWLGATALAAVLVGVSGALTAMALGEFTNAFWGVSAALAFGGFASACVVAVTYDFFKEVGLGIASLLLVPLGVATSGALVSSYFLPAFYAAIAPYMLSSATIDAVRQAAYLNNVAIAQPYTVLATWAIVPLAIIALSAMLRKSQPEK